MRLGLLFVLFLTCPAAYAHVEDANDGHSQQCSISQTSETQKLLSEFHQILEGSTAGDHPHSVQEALKKLTTWSGLREWVRSFNLKQAVNRACRFYNIKSVDGRIQGHVANLAFVLPLSHSLEMLSGPLLTSLSVGAGWPSYVSGAFSVVGAVISIPGVDPVCIMIYSSYPLRPVQNAITWVREKTVTAVGFVGQVTGLSALGQNLGDKWNLNKIQNASHAMDFSDSVVQIQLPNSKPLTLNWDTSRNYFESVTIPLNVTEPELKKAIQPLPANVRSAVIEAYDFATKQKSIPFYVTDVLHTDGVFRISWTPHAVRTKYLPRCADLLG